jgi:hypothetical protein
MCVNTPLRSRIALFCFLLAACIHLHADPVAARMKQGVGHIFLLILDENGKMLATGESFQTVKAYTVSTRTTFHFRDGSLDDETTVFEQRVNLRVLSDDHLQKGPAFPHPMEIRIEAVNGQVVVHNLESGKTETHSLKIPFDLANGIITQLLQNLPQDTVETKVSYLLPTSSPRLAKLVISRAGEDTYTLGGERQTAQKLQLKVDLGGLAGLIAPVIGKEPKPTEVWMAGGRVPMFIRIRTQFYEGAPLWTIQQTAPGWPSEEK